MSRGRYDILVRKPDQLMAVTEGRVRADRIYVDTQLLDRLESILTSSGGRDDLYGDKAPRYYAALPYVLRNEEGMRDAGWYYDLVARCPFTEGVLVREPEALYFFYKKKESLEYDGTVVADHSIGIWNHHAYAGLLYGTEGGKLFDEWTITPELSRGEIYELIRAIEREEGASLPYSFTMYGRMPMMVSANCVRQTHSSCGGRRGSDSEYELSLRDRTDRQNPVTCICSTCYNVIWNAVPLSLHRETGRIRERYPEARMRLEFTTESYEETAGVIRYYEEILSGDKASVPGAPYEYTAGRYIKGVE